MKVLCFGLFVLFAFSIQCHSQWFPHVEVQNDTTLIQDKKASLNQAPNSRHSTNNIQNEMPPPFPPGPKLIEPAKGTQNMPLSVTVTWSPFLPSDSFMVYCSIDSFTETAYFHSSFLKDTFYVFSNLKPSTTYYWKVKSEMSDPRSAAESAIWSFTTRINAPMLILPGNNAADVCTTQTFRWKKIVNAISYRLQIGSHGFFSSLFFKDTSGIKDTSLSVSGFSPNTTYYWCVSATNTSGTSEYISPTWLFTTGLLS